MIQRINPTLTVSTSAYTANDVVGGLLTVDMSAVRGGGILNKVVLVDDDNEKAAMMLWLFNAAPTTIADNAAFAPTIADLKKVVSKVPIVADDYVTVNGNAVAVVTDVNDTTPLSGTYYAYLVTSGTPTYANAADLWLALDFVAEPRGKF